MLCTQVVTKQVVKCEFMLGLASLMVHTLGSGQLAHVQQMIAEIIENLEVTRACLRAGEVEATFDQWEVMTPAPAPLMVAWNLFIRMYPRMAEIVHQLGSSSLMAIPTAADLHGPLATEIHSYLDTATASAEERIRLFRLAWDTCCSAFASFRAGIIPSAELYLVMRVAAYGQSWRQHHLPMFKGYGLVRHFYALSATSYQVWSSPSVSQTIR